MRTIVALVVKFLLTTAVAAVAFRPLGNPWGTIVALGIAGTALNYILGDLIVLPSMGNVVASVADGGLAAVTAYVWDRLSTAFDTTTGSLLLFGLLVAVAEYFFHKYLAADRKVAP